MSVVDCSEADTDNHCSVGVTRVTKMRERASPTIEPFTHGAQSVGQPGEIYSYLNGSHRRFTATTPY
jgi:hypothetical protein